MEPEDSQIDLLATVERPFQAGLNLLLTGLNLLLTGLSRHPYPVFLGLIRRLARRFRELDRILPSGRIRVRLGGTI
jgi:hypothetical protein